MSATKSSSQSAPPPFPATERNTAIVSPQFCTPTPTELTFFTKASWLKPGRLAVTDPSGGGVFEVQSRTWDPRCRQVLSDAAGNPVISMKRKLGSLHDIWQVFRGEGWDRKDLLFTVRRRCAFQLRRELEVFLAGKDGGEEEACDFKISGSYRKKACTVYKGSDYSTVIAQMMSGDGGAGNGSGRKHVFRVAVSPNVDCCLIAALVVVVRRLHRDIKTGLAAGISAGVIAAALALI